MGLSVNEFTYAGTNEFDLNFALGFNSRADISCYVDCTVPVNVSFDWLTSNRVRINPADVVLGDKIVFRRTVSKTSLPVDLTQPSSLTRENVQTAVVHSLMAFHELLDGRFGDLVEVSDAVYTGVENAVSSALSNFLFSADFKQDLRLTLSGNSSSVLWVSAGYRVDTSNASIFVTSTPSEDVEILVEHNNEVVLAFTVDTYGEVTLTTSTIFTTVDGDFVFSVSSDNYTSGVEVQLVLPSSHTSVVDFDTSLGNYVEIFENARNAP